MKRLALASALAVGLLAMGSGEAKADSCSEKQEEASTGKGYKMVKGPDGRRVFVIEKAFVVCGKVPKPNVIYVLQATAINYEWENLKQDFLPKIRQSVKKAPF